MTEHMMDGSVDLDDIMFNLDSDVGMVDPQLSMSTVFGNLSGKAQDPFSVDATWDGSLAAFNPQDLQNFPAVDDVNESITAASSPTEANKSTHARAKSSRTSSKSSVPSLSSGASSPGAKQTRSKGSKTKEVKEVKENKTAKQTKASTKDTKDVKDAKDAKDAKQPAKKKQKTKKMAVELSEDEDDSKRNKYLERNRIAASKCRQKKKVWVSDLETQKSEMEAKHSNLQGEYAALVEQVTELKTELMGHAGCGDPNIDGWIETEAKRFVQRTTDRPAADMSRRLSNSADAEHCPSLGGMS